MLRRSGWMLASLASCVGACGNESTSRPDFAAGCRDRSCVSGGSVMGQGFVASSADSGVDAGPGTLEGEVVVVTSPDLLAREPLSGAVLELLAISEDGVHTRLEIDTGSFELSLRGREPHWLGVRQLEGGAELFTTWSRVEAGTAASVPILERAVIDDLFDQLVLAPLDPDPMRAHAIVHFSRRGAALPGVSVELTQGVVAYDAGGLYSDALEATQERGVAALLGLPAVPFPGGSFDAVTVLQLEEQRFELHLAQDAVTLLDVEL